MTNAGWLRLRSAALLAGVGLCVAVGRPWAYEQEIEILNPAQEQRIDILEGGEQRVAVVDAHEYEGPARRRRLGSGVTAVQRMPGRYRYA